MPIPVACQCGQKFQAPDALAGQKAKCPKCGAVLAIAAGAAASAGTAGALASASLFDDGGIKQGRKCGNCKAIVREDAVLCVECGYHFESGKLVEGALSSAGGHAGDAARLMKRAEDEMSQGPQKASKAYGSKTEAWLTLLILVVVLGGGIAGLIALFLSLQDAVSDDEEDSRLPPGGLPRAVATARL